MSADTRAGKRVTVVGSFAVGLTLRAERMPTAGETVLAKDFNQGPGGKGSNQAVQVARLGGNVELVAMIGMDYFGDMAMALYDRERVGTTFVQRTGDRTTGVGFILLDESGQNRILVDPGANDLFSPLHVEKAATRIAESDALITQLEIPVETAARAMALAAESGVRSILNPAPGRQLGPDVLSQVDIVTPNQSEARILIGLAADDPMEDIDVCRELLVRGVRSVVMTRGERGVLMTTPEGESVVHPHEVRPVDTTGAGDAFNGALAAALAQGLALEDAVSLANAAGALACTRLGVVPSLPTSAELDDYLRGVSPR